MIRIPTRDLVGLLTDLALTAADPATAGATAGVLLHTARGYLGGSPGQVDLFVGTSTDGVILGHAHIACSGQDEPMLWPIAAVKDVIAVLKPKAKIDDHVTEITREGDDITLAEDPDLFGEGARFTFGGLDPVEWPTEDARQMLAEISMSPPEGSQPPAPRIDFLAARLTPFLSIASRRKEILQTFRYHQRLPMSVQIGDHYRGVVNPFRFNDEKPTAGYAPSGDVFPLVLDGVPA
jgi:hypothetical protein